MTRLNDERLTAIVGELASKPGHDKVKAAIQDLLVDGLGAERNHVRFEQRVPEAQGRIDAILGRTAFEVKSDLIREIGDAKAQLARYLPERESATKSRFVGIRFTFRRKSDASTLLLEIRHGLPFATCRTISRSGSRSLRRVKAFT